jgi:hypothetical protein
LLVRGRAVVSDKLHQPPQASGHGDLSFAEADHTVIILRMEPGESEPTHVLIVIMRQIIMTTRYCTRYRARAVTLFHKSMV